MNRWDEASTSVTRLGRARSPDGDAPTSTVRPRSALPADDGGTTRAFIRGRAPAGPDPTVSRPEPPGRRPERRAAVARPPGHRPAGWQSVVERSAGAPAPRAPGGPSTPRSRGHPGHGTIGAFGTHSETATTWLRFFSPTDPSSPVFVDGSGRRRLLWRVVGVLVALVCVAFVALIVFAAVSGSPTNPTEPSLGSLPAATSATTVSPAAPGP